MWLIVALMIPLIAAVVMVVADVSRESVSDWQAYWLAVFFFSLPVLAYGSALMHLFTK